MPCALRCPCRRRDITSSLVRKVRSRLLVQSIARTARSDIFVVRRRQRRPKPQTSASRERIAHFGPQPALCVVLARTRTKKSNHDASHALRENLARIPPSLEFATAAHSADMATTDASLVYPESTVRQGQPIAALALLDLSAWTLPLILNLAPMVR